MKRGRELRIWRENFDIKGKKEGGGGNSERLFCNQNNYTPDFRTYNNNYTLLYYIYSNIYT